MRDGFLFFLLSLITFFFLNSICPEINNAVVIYDLTLSQFLYILGQTLSEEIILGYLLVTRFALSAPLVRQLSAIICLSLLFSLLHQMLYTNPFRHAPDPLIFSSLFCLFLFGFLRFAGFIIFSNISFSWGIHFGWNLAFLPTNFIYFTGTEMREPQKYNFIFSNVSLILFIFLLSIILLFLYFNVKKFSIKSFNMDLQ